ncbi:MAG: hypothetical protein HKM04_06160 [Legionellales bacterium]|nr:hypothetical protein [Legionellales bacterium]
MLKRISLKRKLSTLTQKLRQKSTRKAMYLIAVLLSLLLARAALASSGTDFDLSSLDDATENHVKGDFGRLVAMITLVLGIIIAGFKQQYLILLGCLVVLLGIGFGPDIIDSMTGG